MQPYRENACLTEEDVNWAIERMQLSQLRQEFSHDRQRELTILSRIISSPESHTFDANTWRMILRDLINIQKETFPNQVPFSILKLYKKIFKKLDILWKTDPNTIPPAIHTLANMATGPLVQQAIVDSKNLSILKKILIYA